MNLTAIGGGQTLIWNERQQEWLPIAGVPLGEAFSNFLDSADFSKMTEA